MNHYYEKSTECYCMDWEVYLGDKILPCTSRFKPSSDAYEIIRPNPVVYEDFWVNRISDNNRPIEKNGGLSLAEWSQDRWIRGEGYGRLLSKDTVWHRTSLVTKLVQNPVVKGSRYGFFGFDTEHCLFLFYVQCAYVVNSLSTIDAVPDLRFVLLDKAIIPPKKRLTVQEPLEDTLDEWVGEHHWRRSSSFLPLPCYPLSEHKVAITEEFLSQPFEVKWEEQNGGQIVMDEFERVLIDWFRNELFGYPDCPTFDSIDFTREVGFWNFVDRLKGFVRAVF